MFINIIKDTFVEMLPILILFVVATTIVRYFEIKTERRKLRIFEEIMNIVFILYILILFAFLAKTEVNIVQGYNLVPFQEILRHPFGSELFMYNVLGNILVFLPLGVIVAYKIKPKRLAPFVGVILVISLSIEITQLYVGRIFDVDDIILNVFGGILGFYIYKIFAFLSFQVPTIFNKRNIITLILILVIIGLIIYLLNQAGVLNLFEAI